MQDIHIIIWNSYERKESCGSTVKDDLIDEKIFQNPEPLLNKTVKQYLSNSEGKLLFSLVREFLEYFGLDYTISVYDPETYFGKEYNYVGRNKLSEELGIDSTEPLLGEILKNSINGAFNSSQKVVFLWIELIIVINCNC